MIKTDAFPTIQMKINKLLKLTNRYRFYDLVKAVYCINLCINNRSCIIPISELQKGFDPVPSSLTKQEDCTGCRIHLKLVFNHGTEAIDRFAYICIAAGNVNLFEAGDIT